jgi:hypothetical protein
MKTAKLSLISIFTLTSPAGCDVTQVSWHRLVADPRGSSLPGGRHRRFGGEPPVSC